MKIRNDDRIAYREGRHEEIEPEVLEYLKSLEPQVQKPVSKKAKEDTEQEKGE